LGDRLLDAPPGFVADGRLAVDDARDGLVGDAGNLGDILETRQHPRVL
jgi:hypothetical protein